MPAGAPRADRGQPAGHGVRRAGRDRAALADRGHPRPRHRPPAAGPRPPRQHRALRRLTAAPVRAGRALRGPPVFTCPAPARPARAPACGTR
ncbi:hypothetical protein SCOCK_480031 [Actinacidiphila cocklensis]|uniref:Uncharacterized protein n=1 Tax=Actinacidiphila cocklensis TaxID=887465 RepID=A0A9W4DVU2_9ACTN|nr:hypothetical protein SCOCK_480031 [Actinacidiphila cocklensis]